MKLYFEKHWKQTSFIAFNQFYVNYYMASAILVWLEMRTIMFTFRMIESSYNSRYIGMIIWPNNKKIIKNILGLTFISCFKTLKAFLVSIYSLPLSNIVLSWRLFTAKKTTHDNLWTFFGLVFLKKTQSFLIVLICSSNFYLHFCNLKVANRFFFLFFFETIKSSLLR